MSFIKILLEHWGWIDTCILIILIVNIFLIYRHAWLSANRLYKHFSKTDRISALPEDAAGNIRALTAEEKIMTSEQLLECRDRMNKFYSAFTIITTMFPLLGMLGTVISLIPMVDTIGAAETQLFFGALTSTFWGIVSALFCKFLDIFIGFKIEDSEKHVEFLLNPKRNREES